MRDRWLRDKDGNIMLPTDRKEPEIPLFVDVIELCLLLALLVWLIFGDL